LLNTRFYQYSIKAKKMKAEDVNIYRCPACLSKLTIGKSVTDKDVIINGTLQCSNGHSFTITEGIPDFTWPKELAVIDEHTRLTYEKLAREYDKYASFPFWTFKSDENEVRSNMTDRLNLKKDSIVLEIGAGDGRGAEHVAKRLGPGGRFYVQELSISFLRKSFERLKQYKDLVEFSTANASYISFPDKYFDAAYHFGGISTFSDVKRCLAELCRVVKVGGKVLVGDESMGAWLRDTEFGKIMMNSNPLFKYEIPYKDIPVEARDVKVEWIMMGAFFLLEFTVGEGTPEADYHIPIPSERGGTHWTRYYGNLEGVSDETKKLAYKAREKSGKSMSEWLEEAVKKAAEEELKR
jgi:ubiquinone/menaquinone biosynthesis C-methylase UbiE